MLLAMCPQPLDCLQQGITLSQHPISENLDDRVEIALSLRNVIAFVEQPIQLWNMQMSKMVQTSKKKLPYEGMNITGATGISEGQKANLKA